MKALKVIGVIFAVLIVVVLVAPLFYDVNTKIKPQIQTAIEENLNAKAEIGKLSLGVLFGINIGIESLKIIETADNNVFFEMKDAKLKIPYASLFTGKVAITLDAKSPTLKLNRDAQGNLNVSKLMKPKKAEAPAEKSGDGSAGGSAALGKIDFSTDITDANIEFHDRQAGTDYKINRLDFKSHNIGIGHPFETEVSANLDINNKRDMKVSGKVVFSGKTEIAMDGSNLEKVVSKAKLDLTDVEVSQPSLNKAKGSPLTLDTDILVSKDMTYSGTATLKGADFRVAGFVPKATDVVGDFQIKTNELDIKKMSMKVGSSDFNLSGSVKDFEAPVVNLTFSSKKLNLDEMLPKPKEGSGKGSAEPEDPKALEKSLAELEGPIAMVRQNPVLRKMNLRAQTSIDSLIMKNAEISNIKAVATFRDLVLSMDNTTLAAFNGSGNVDLKIDFSQRKPSYSFKAKVQKLDTNKAMVSQFKDLDKTLTGLANASFEIKGSGVTMDDLNKNLNGRGNMNVENGSWSGLGVLKAVGDKLKSIPKAGEMVSGIKISDKFKTLKSDFSIGGGRFNILNGIMEMEGANTSVTLNGFVAFTKDMLMKGDIVAPMGQVPKKMSTSDGRGKVPYEVKGTVDNPKVDWDKTLGPVATAFAQQEGEKLIKKEVDKIKNDAVKKLFKGIKL